MSEVIELDDVTLNLYRVRENREHDGQGAGAEFKLTEKEAAPFKDKLEMVKKGVGIKDAKPGNSFIETVNKEKLLKADEGEVKKSVPKKSKQGKTPAGGE